jgi:hypothetical protein
MLAATELPPLTLPQKSMANLLRVRHYLQSQRRLPASVIEPLIDAGVLYADPRANAVFILLGKENRAVGAEMRGTGAVPWRALAVGSRKDDGFFRVAPSTDDPAGYGAILLCESAIDAISCFTFHRDCLCVSTAGVRANPRWLDPLLRQDRPVYCAFDADPPGDNAAQAMIALHPAIQRLRPLKKDWNQMLASMA